MGRPPTELADHPTWMMEHLALVRRRAGSVDLASPTSTSSSAGFRPDVEGLRGLAVLVVVLFHAGLAGMGGGFVGVDVFFVISGFLITGLLVREHGRTGRISLLRFYARRVRRLLPAATVVLVATLIAALILMSPLDRSTVSLDAVASALSVGNVRFAAAAGDYFTSLAAPSPFLHFWSLAVEEQFYLVWPALILLVARGVHARRRIMVTLAVVVIASFAANLFLTDAAANWAFYSLPTRAWELGLGGLLAVGATSIARIPSNLVGLAGWLGLGAVVAAVMTFDSGLAYPGVAALLPAAGAVSLLASGTSAIGPGRLMSVGPLRFLGRISYSLYLVHWPVLILGPLALGSAQGGSVRGGLVILSVAIAFGLWALVETPFRTGFPSLSPRPRRTIGFGLSAILAVVVLAAGPSLGLLSTRTVASTASQGEVWADETPVAMLAPELATASPAEAVDPTAEASLPTTAATQTAAPALQTSNTGAPTPEASRSPAVVAPTVVPPTVVPALDTANTGVPSAGLTPSLANSRTDEERLRCRRMSCD